MALIEAPLAGKNQCRARAVKHDLVDKFLPQEVVGGSGVGLGQNGEVVAMCAVHERGGQVKFVDDRFEGFDARCSAFLPKAWRGLLGLVAQRVIPAWGEFGN